MSLSDAYVVKTFVLYLGILKKLALFYEFLFLFYEFLFFFYVLIS